MSAKFSFGKIEFQLGAERSRTRPQRDNDTAFRLAVLGDFGGRAHRGVIEPIASRRAFRIDCDNFDEVASLLSPTLRLPAHWDLSENIELRFASLEDFHPDKILAQVRPLTGLLDQRQRLLNPSTASEAEAELQSLLAIEPKAASIPATAESNAETLARLLVGPPPRPASPLPASASPEISQLLHHIVAPSVVPGTTTEQAALLAALDLELTHQLRAILHHPEFQALESAWRGVDLLVRQFGADKNIRLYLLDVAKEELASDLQAHDDLAAGGAGKMLRTETAGEPWAALIGHYTFRATVAGIEMLGRLSKISSLLGAPFLAGATQQFVGCDSFAAHPDPDDWTRKVDAEVCECWQALRELPEASYLGLALPRFVLRQPYGKGSDPIRAFPFEELPPDAPHESYLWGNPAVLCGFLLADAFQAEGWEMQATGSGEVGDLPVHKFKRAGETQVKPCAEAWLSDRAEEAILRDGLMPFLSIKGRDAVRLSSLRSVSSSSFGLKGPWR